jgi:hypothetical protein
MAIVIWVYPSLSIIIQDYLIHVPLTCNNLGNLRPTRQMGGYTSARTSNPRRKFGADHGDHAMDAKQCTPRYTFPAGKNRIFAEYRSYIGNVCSCLLCGDLDWTYAKKINSLIISGLF